MTSASRRITRRRFLIGLGATLPTVALLNACSSAPAAPAKPTEAAKPAATTQAIAPAPTPVQVVVAQASPAAGASPAVAASPAASPMPSPAAVAPAAPQPAAAASAGSGNRNLTIAVPNSAPASWPFFRGAAVGGVLLYWSVWEGLYGLDNSDNPQWVPQLATGFTFSEGGKVFDFTMRPGIKWHNGDPVTADDAVWSLNTFMPKPYPALAPTWDRAEKVSDTQVRIYLKQPDASLIGMLAWQGWILPKKYWESVGGQEGFAKAPIGSGPYKLTQYVQDDRFVMEAVPDHWRGRPFFDKVTVRIVPEDATRVAMIRSGEADVIWGANPRLFEQNKDAEGLKGIAVAGGRLTHYQITAGATEKWSLTDPALKPWTNLKVRQAANYAVNRDEMAKQLWLGHVTPIGAAIAPTLMPPPAGLTPYPFDPAKAKQLLAEAGYPDGFDTFIIDGATPSYVLQREMDQAVANYLTQVGIRTQVKFVENGQLVDMQSKRDKNVLPLMFRSVGASIRHPSNRGQELRCPKDPTDEGYSCDPGIEGKFDAGKAILDGAESTKFYQDLETYVKENAAEITLWEDPDYFIMKKDVDWKIVGGTTYRYNLQLAKRTGA